MAPSVRYELSGPVARITLDRPEVKNALDLEVIRSLLEALERAKGDAGVRAIVLQGSGGDFSSGGDIKDMVARRGQAVVTYDRLRLGLMDVVRSLTRHPLPVIARVDGVCLGAGGGLALSCDVLLATSRSTFGFPFARVGLVPDTATSWLLPHIVGVQNARRLLLTGESIGAGEAAGMGLATKVVSDGTALDAEVEAWAQRFVALPTTAVRDVKRLLWSNVSASLETAVTHEALMQGVRFTTEDHARAVDAFLSARRR